MRSQSVSAPVSGAAPRAAQNRPMSGSHARARTPAPHLDEGSRVAGRYRIGGRTENRRDQQVYDAWDERIERWVHLTVSRRPAVRDARLVHDGIAQPEEVGCIGSWFVSVLDPGIGESLGRLLGRLSPETPLDLESWMIFGLGLCEALDHAGRFGVVHGDIGTRAIHVTPQFDPVLLGFPVRPNGPISKASRAFASPERILGHDPDAASDVYSVAALLYTLRTGEPPFGWSDEEAREGHLYHLLEAHPRIPGRVMRELQTAMEKPARLRHPTLRHFADAMSAAYQASVDGWLAEDLPDSVPGLEDDTTEEVALIEPTAGFDSSGFDGAGVATTGFEHSGMDVSEDHPTEIPAHRELPIPEEGTDEVDFELEIETASASHNHFEPPIDPGWGAVEPAQDDLVLEDASVVEEALPAPVGHGLARRLAGPAGSAPKRRTQPVARLHELVQGHGTPNTRPVLEPIAAGSMNDQTLELGPDMLDLDGDVTLELGAEYLASPSAHTPPPQTGPRAHRPSPVSEAAEAGASRGRALPGHKRVNRPDVSGGGSLADRAPAPGVAPQLPAVRFVPPAPLSAVPSRDAGEFGWEDTLDDIELGTAGFLTDPGAIETHLPAIALATVCALAVGMAGAASVVAVVLASIL